MVASNNNHRSSARGTSTHLATTWWSWPKRSAAALTKSGEQAYGTDEKSGPGRYRPSWSRRSSAGASSSHSLLVLGLGFLGCGSSMESAAGGRGFGFWRSAKRDESFGAESSSPEPAGGGRGFSFWRGARTGESFDAGAAAAEEERRRAPESAMGLVRALRRGRDHSWPSDQTFDGVDCADPKFV